MTTTRSHMIVKLYIETINMNDDLPSNHWAPNRILPLTIATEYDITSSILTFVKSSGSERISKVNSSGQSLKEAVLISRSLSSLGNVISSIATKSKHIPFRDSRLTHLLAKSLDGTGNIAFIG